MLVVPTEGELIALKLILGAEVAEDLLLKLFVNDVTPTKATTSTDFVEPVGFGYDPFTLTKGSAWNFQTGDPSKAESTYLTWIFTGALGNVYGYWIQGADSGLVYWAERFAAPVAVTTDGDEITVPVIQTCD